MLIGSPEPAKQEIIHHRNRPFNPNPRGGGKGRGLGRKSHDPLNEGIILTNMGMFPDRISQRPPPVKLQPNGLPVPLGRSKPRRRGKRGGKGKVHGKFIRVTPPENLLSPNPSVAPANEAGPSNQEVEDVPMGEVEQGIANMMQPYLGTEEEEEPYYEGHDPLSFGAEA